MEYIIHLKKKRGLAQSDGQRFAGYLMARCRRASLCASPAPTISTVFQAVKVSSMIGINMRRRERGELGQPRFFDPALRTVKEYNETVEYIHLNPVRRGLVRQATDWKWSSVHEYAGISGEEQERRCGLRIDRACLPADENTCI